MPDDVKYIRCASCGFVGPQGEPVDGSEVCPQCGAGEIIALLPPAEAGAAPSVVRWWEPVAGIVGYVGIFLGIPILALALLVWMLWPESEPSFIGSPPPVALTPPPPVAGGKANAPITEIVRCIGVLDGQTLVIEGAGYAVNQTVRLRSVEVPDFDGFTRIEAATYLRDLCINRSLRLTMYKPRLRNAQGDLLASVEVVNEDNETTHDVERVLVRHGFAWVTAQPYSTQRLHELLILEETARQARRGFWARR